MTNSLEADVKLTTDGYYHERRGAVAILPAWLTPEMRFWRYVRVSDEDSCWEWIGVGGREYGHFRYLRKNLKAHRASYLLFVGDPGDLLVCHHCDNRRCVRPSHLFLGTMSDNTKDCISKGRFKTPFVKGDANPMSRFSRIQRGEVVKNG